MKSRRFIFLFLSFITLMVTTHSAKATHLMGGELTYTYSGPFQGGSFYDVKLIVYRYCDSTGAIPAALDPQMYLGIYITDSLNPSPSKIWYSTEILPLIGSDVVAYSPNSNCTFEASACIERGEYTVTILLPDNIEGFHLSVERCCRNGNILNIAQPGAAGMTFYAYIPNTIINSTPQISDVSVPFVCINDTTTILNNAIDPDGDSLAYSLVIPYAGYSGQSNPAPDPFLDNNPYTLPIPDVTYAPGFSSTQVFGAGGFASVDPINGLSKFYFNNQGFYVAAIEIREYRNGVLISMIRRDLQLITIVCNPNAVPVLSNTTGTSTYTISEGQNLCFFATFNDADGDSLFLTASGQLLDPLQVNPPGIMPDASGAGTVTSQFCWTPICGMSRPTPYQFFVTVVDDGCPSKITNQIFSVYVTSGPASLTPTVNITRSPSGIVCQGSQITLSANPFLGGSAPIYSWTVNGSPVGTNSPTYTSSNFSNGDVVLVTMISNASCALVDTVHSPPFVITISSIPAPIVSITSSFGSVLCPQQICLYSAVTSNTGSNPVYQWMINGSAAGTNIPQFTAASPSGILAVYLIVTPSTGCPPQESNTIVYNIPPTVEPEIEMFTDITGTICPGQEIMFTAEAFVTPGYPTVFNWLINGANQFINNDTIVLSNLQDGDEVTVTATSGYPCLSPTYAYADPLIYNIYDSLAADLTDGPFQICAGTEIDLIMNTAGGNSVTYTYDWSTGNSVSNQLSFIPVTTGFYYASVDDVCYDEITDSVFIEVYPLPEAEFEYLPVKPTFLDPTITFTDLSLDALSWSWNFGDTLLITEQNPVYVFKSYGNFPVELVVTNSFGCTDTALREIIIDDFITAYIPNSFTPNDDGINDQFGVTGFSNGGFSMQIFNRWGQTVFTSENSFQSWNGKTLSGKSAPQGIYTYLITITKDKSHKPLYGTISLIR
ncbi:MAG: gliding motility-associated C-terminal domain-containing protein [Bacteroidetes bacterium]|nr:gliding motility-associated C-terminal domain-containing protein [Bacteroidota bacterium]